MSTKEDLDKVFPINIDRVSVKDIEDSLDPQIAIGVEAGNWNVLARHVYSLMLGVVKFERNLNDRRQT